MLQVAVSRVAQGGLMISEEDLFHCASRFRAVLLVQ